MTRSFRWRTVAGIGGGWREMKLGIFSKRQRGEPALPDEWESRSLPQPNVRIAFAAIEKSEEFSVLMPSPASRPDRADQRGNAAMRRFAGFGSTARIPYLRSLPFQMP